jgi:hypothetical protein
MNKNEFAEYVKEIVIAGKRDGFDKIRIEEENESDGLSLTLYFVKGDTGIGKRIDAFKEHFYKIKQADMNKIKKELNLRKIKISEREDFGEWVKTIEIDLK